MWVHVGPIFTGTLKIFVGGNGTTIRQQPAPGGWIGAAVPAIYYGGYWLALAWVVRIHL
jgi:hypothetical protein